MDANLRQKSSAFCHFFNDTVGI